MCIVPISIFPDSHRIAFNHFTLSFRQYCVVGVDLGSCNFFNQLIADFADTEIINH